MAWAPSMPAPVVTPSAAFTASVSQSDILTNVQAYKYTDTETHRHTVFHRLHHVQNLELLHQDINDNLTYRF